MSSLRKLIVRGDFDEISSNEEENILLQTITMSGLQNNQQEQRHVGSGTSFHSS